MDLFLVRHAIAEDRDDWATTGLPDSRRPLTARGRAKMKGAARGLAAIVGSIDLLATSPYERAAATASLLGRALGNPRIVHIDALAAGRPAADLLRWLASRREKRVLLVGHEPDLGHLVALLLGDNSPPPFAMKKGGACLLRARQSPSEGSAELRWFLAPSILRRIPT